MDLAGFFRKRNSQAVPEGMLDKEKVSWEGGGGEEDRRDDDHVLEEDVSPSLDVVLTFWDVDDWVIRFEAIGKSFEAFDCPMLEHHELHLERRGSGAWYASLVDYQTGRIAASGRLHLH